MAKPDIYERKTIDVLSPALKQQVAEYALIQAFNMFGCTRADGFREIGRMPQAPMERVSVFKTDEQKGTYNHHTCLTKWKDRYWLAWDSSLEHEEYPGQKTLISSSLDGFDWSEPTVVAPGDAEKGMLRNIGGICVGPDDRLYALIQEKRDLVHATSPGMNIHDNTKTSTRYDIFESSDGVNWTQHKGFLRDTLWIMENPRLTQQGRLLGPATTHDLKPAVLLWPGDDPLAEPETIRIPYAADPINYQQGHDEGLFPYGESSWYEDDEGRIWMWHRDESACRYLGVALSEDGGRSWTEVIRSNFPDAVSRVFAGRLSDGRFYMVGNAIAQHMDRNFFALSLSEDGAKFNQMYQLIAEPTRQRFHGFLKVHGYQYPSCYVDDDKLITAYSVNKEDIEVGILDIAKLV